MTGAGELALADDDGLSGERVRASLMPLPPADSSTAGSKTIARPAKGVQPP